MKNILLIFSLITSINAFGQFDRAELPLTLEENFDINFMFHYDNDSLGYSVNFVRENKVDKIRINGDCRRNGSNLSYLMVDNYHFNQLLEYLQNTGVFTYQPSRNMQDKDSKLRVLFSVSKQSNLSVNAFEIQHDPEIQGDEYQILELMSKALKDNAIDSCVAEFAEKFEKYVTGRE